MTASSQPPLVRMHDIHASYGHIRALNGVSLEIARGSIVALLGANGAGKSTTLRVLSGQLAPVSGLLEYRGKSSAGLRPGQLVRKGLVHVPEGRRVFTEFTVEENLKVGAYTRDSRRARETCATVYSIFPILADRRRQRAGSLSGGEQQMLAIGRALMAEPELMLLDEPSLGLAPLVVKEIYRVIAHLNESQGVTVLLVEQNVALALEVANYAYVLESGSTVLAGTPDEFRSHDELRRKYLGY